MSCGETYTELTILALFKGKFSGISSHPCVSVIGTLSSSHLETHSGRSLTQWPAGTTEPEQPQTYPNPNPQTYFKHYKFCVSVCVCDLGVLSYKCVALQHRL